MIGNTIEQPRLSPHHIHFIVENLIPNEHKRIFRSLYRNTSFLSKGLKVAKKIFLGSKQPNLNRKNTPEEEQKKEEILRKIIEISGLSQKEQKLLSEYSIKSLTVEEKTQEEELKRKLEKAAREYFTKLQNN